MPRRRACHVDLESERSGCPNAPQVRFRSRDKIPHQAWIQGVSLGDVGALATGVLFDPPLAGLGTQVRTQIQVLRWLSSYLVDLGPVYLTGLLRG